MSILKIGQIKNTTPINETTNVDVSLDKRVMTVSIGTNALATSYISITSPTMGTINETSFIQADKSYVLTFALKRTAKDSLEKYASRITLNLILYKNVDNVVQTQHISRITLPQITGQSKEDGTGYTFPTQTYTFVCPFEPNDSYSEIAIQKQGLVQSDLVTSDAAISSMDAATINVWNEISCDITDVNLEYFNNLLETLNNMPQLLKAINFISSDNSLLCINGAAFETKDFSLDTMDINFLGIKSLKNNVSYFLNYYYQQ